MNRHRLIEGWYYGAVRVAFLFSMTWLAGAAGLRTEFGAAGLNKIEYDGITLTDTATNPQDAFGIGEYRRIRRNGSAQSFSGDSDVARSWNPTASTLTLAYPWGSVKAAFKQFGNTLKISVAVTNTDRDSQLEGLNIYPLALHFPRMPEGFFNLNYPQIKFGTDGPAVTAADYGSGMVAIVDEGSMKPLYTGFSSTGTLAYRVLIGSTYNSGQPQSWPKNTRPIPPGGTDRYTVSLRFAPSGSPVEKIALDAYTRYRSLWPFRVAWPDRRPVGALFLSSSGSGDIHQKAGFPTNPRRYFNDPKVDVTTPSGLRAFQERVLSGADGSIAVVKNVGGQGVIAWDIEGQEYPQSTSYVCDPEKLQQLAPEMESAIPNGSPYAGMHLADAFFKKFKDAGLKIGVCIRPQEFVIQPNGSASQAYLDAGLNSQSQISAAVSKELIRKIKYAKTRWAIDFVYIDSTVTESGGALGADVFRSVLTAFPEMLLIPEQKTSAHFAYAAPWSQPSSMGAYVRTPAEVKRLYPQAFSSIYIADAPRNAQTGNLNHYDQYVQGVREGDILIFRAFFDDAYFNSQVKKIYAEASSLNSAANSFPTYGQQTLFATAFIIAGSFVACQFLAFRARHASQVPRRIDPGS